MAEIGSGTGTSYPGAIDTDSSIEVNSPNVNKTRAKAETINDAIAALLAVENELGTDPAGTLADIKTWLQTEHNNNATHRFPLTAGSIPFIISNGGLSEDNSNLYWDNINKRFTLGPIANASEHLLVGSTTDTIVKSKTSASGGSPTYSLATPTREWWLGIEGITDRFIIRDVSIGLNRLIINTAGEIGIGTTPESSVKMRIETATDTILKLKSTGIDSAPFFTITNDAREYFIKLDGLDSDSLKIRDATAGADRIIINTSGNVQIPQGIDSGANGIYLKTKVLEIGDWNMDSTVQVIVAHGLTLANIRRISTIIRSDANTPYNDFPTDATGATSGDEIVYATSSSIVLTRSTGGTFDNTTYDSTGFNRGWIIIDYV